MSTRIRNRTAEGKRSRFRRKKRIAESVYGTAERPRLSIFKSNSHLYAQVIDDVKGVTLSAASSAEVETKGKFKHNIEGAKSLGGLVAKRALAKKVSKVVFDRGGYVYHGRIKALADGAREGGLKF